MNMDEHGQMQPATGIYGNTLAAKDGQSSMPGEISGTSPLVLELTWHSHAQARQPCAMRHLRPVEVYPFALMDARTASEKDLCVFETLICKKVDCCAIG